MSPSPDLLLRNARIHTGLGEAEALAVRHGRVLAVGRDDEVAALADAATPIVDVGGRRVVPGLIDSHIHAVRTGLDWDDEVRWDDARTLAEALGRLRGAAATRSPGQWLRVIGGWSPGQLRERRGPTRAELDEVAPHHPVYLQAGYVEAWTNSAGLAVCEIDENTPDPEGGGFERDGAGLTGRMVGVGAFRLFLDRMGASPFDRAVRSTAAFLGELAGLGLTGVIDAGGFGVTPETYRVIHELRRRDELPLRVRLYVHPHRPGHEVADARTWITYAHPFSGDDLLRLVGMGEVLHFGCHDMIGLTPTDIAADARDELYQISRDLAAAGWPATVHAVLDETVGVVLDAWERVAEEIPLGDLRFSIAHAERIGAANLARVRDLGVGITVQGRLSMEASVSAAAWGEDTLRSCPPLGDMIALGIPVGAGTDGAAAGSPNPWRTLEWLVTGRPFDGGPHRDPAHRLDRVDALRLYTHGSAWFSREETSRGRLLPGWLADLAVLSEDYLTVPEDEIHTLRSLLTLVGGTAVHAAEEFEEAASRPGDDP